MRPCEPPIAKTMQTNEDLILFTSAALRAYEKCAAQIDALRLYYGIDSDGEQVTNEKAGTN